MFLALTLVLVGCDRTSTPGMIGAKAPDFTVKDEERTVSLHDFRGKTVVLNFWASWCQPCIEEAPSMVAMSKQLDGSNVVIVGVSIDENPEAYHRFLRQFGITYLNVRDPQQSAPMKYGTTGWPETFVIDKDGTIRRKFVGAQEWTKPTVVSYLKSL